MSDPKVNVVITVDGKEYTAGVRKATDETKDFGDQARNSSADVNHLSGAVKLLTAGFAALQIGRLVRDIINVNVEFDSLHASLVTVTGSAEAADIAFSTIEDFATKTPYQLQEVVGAFIKLKALGLDPSEAALRAYGNTASGMGKSLDQMIEAVADATTGEFERLKEFGIKSSVQGDKVKFRFRGITTEVGNSATEIEKYLRNIGDVEFAGGMERQMNTLGGNFSNLEDAVTKLARSFGEKSGLNSVLKDSISLITELTNSLSGMPRSISDIEADIAALETKISSTTNRRGRRGGLTLHLAELQAELLQARLGSSNPDQIRNAITTLESQINAAESRIAAIPENQRTSTTGSGRSKRASHFAIENRQLQQLIEDRRALYGRLTTIESEQSKNKTPRTTETPVDATATKAGDSLQQKLEREIALYGAVGQEAKVRYEIEHGALQGLSAAQKDLLIDKANELDFIKANDEAVRDAIATQNEAIATNAQLAAQKQQAAVDALAAVTQMAATETELEAQRYQAALDQLKLAEDAKLKTLVGYDELRTRLKLQHEDRLTKITQQGLSDREKFEQMSALNQSKTVLGFMSGVLGSAAQHNKKLFKINQVVGIANATISTYEGVMKAWAMGPILGPILAPIVLAAGLANISAIKNASFGGGGAVGTYSASPSTGLPTSSADPFARSASAQTAQSSTGGGVSYFNFAGTSNDQLSGEQVEQMFTAIEEATERGDRILFTRNSRQGLELTEGVERAA
ncbi:MAG: tape measure protein [Gammaproteobacteria bacterium]|nr:tape measure protein [Gammaproteobacteria bacterium]